MKKFSLHEAGALLSIRSSDQFLYILFYRYEHISPLSGAVASESVISLKISRSWDELCWKVSAISALSLVISWRLSAGLSSTPVRSSSSSPGIPESAEEEEYCRSPEISLPC